MSRASFLATSISNPTKFPSLSCIAHGTISATPTRSLPLFLISANRSTVLRSGTTISFEVLGKTGGGGAAGVSCAPAIIAHTSSTNKPATRCIDATAAFFISQTPSQLVRNNQQRYLSRRMAAIGVVAIGVSRGKVSLVLHRITFTPPLVVVASALIGILPSHPIPIVVVVHPIVIATIVVIIRFRRSHSRPKNQCTQNPTGNHSARITAAIAASASIGKLRPAPTIHPDSAWIVPPAISQLASRTRDLSRQLNLILRIRAAVAISSIVARAGEPPRLGHRECGSRNNQESGDCTRDPHQRSSEECVTRRQMPDDATSNPIGSRKLFLKIIERKDIHRCEKPTEISKKSI